MFQFIGGIFKWSGIVLVILVLSHIIQIKGVSISDHVDHGLNWVSNSPDHISRSLSGIAPKLDLKNFAGSEDNRLKKIDKIGDEDMPAKDHKELNNVIRRSASTR